MFKLTSFQIRDITLLRHFLVTIQINCNNDFKYFNFSKGHEVQLQCSLFPGFVEGRERIHKIIFG